MAVELTDAQKRSVARGNAATIVRLLTDAGVDATDTDAIAAAVERIMAGVAEEYDIDADIVEDAAEAISESAVAYAVNFGGATADKVAKVASEAAAAITEAVVEAAIEKGATEAETVEAVAAASAGAVQGSTDAAIAAGADLAEVVGKVAEGTIEGAAQGAANSGTDVQTMAEAANEGNEKGAGETGITEVLEGVEKTGDITVAKVTANPPTLKTRETETTNETETKKYIEKYIERYDNDGDLQSP